MLPIGGSRKICQYCTPIDIPSLNIVSTTTEDFPPVPSPTSKDHLTTGNNGSQSLTFKIKPNTKVFYFGAKNSEIGDKIPHYVEAYSHYKNSGVATSNSKGEITIYFDCPTVYVGKDNEIYYRHIHYIEEKNGKWEKTINTKIFVCNITKEQIEKAKNTVLINALPFDVKENIKPTEKSIETMRIPYKLSLEEIKEKLRDVSKSQSIIVYCWNARCTAGHTLIEKLIALGYTNLYDYKGGVEEYFRL
jgi:rhodanese-related sulfurtransferase